MEIIKKIPLSHYVRLLGKYLKKQSLRIIVLYLLIFCGIGLQLVNPQIIKYFIDMAMADASLSFLTLLATFFIIIAVSHQIINLFSSYLGEKVGWIATNSLRKDLVQHSLSQDLSFFNEHSSGEMVQRIEGDIDALSNFFSKFTVVVSSNLCLLFGVVVFLFFENFLLAVGAVLYIIVIYFVINKYNHKITPLWKNVSEISSEYYGFVGEHLEGIDNIRPNGATNYVLNKYREILKKLFPVNLKANITWAKMFTVTNLVYSMGIVTTIAVCFFLWNRGEITLGTIYMALFYLSLIRGPVQSLRQEMEDLQKASASMLRVEEIFQISPEIVDGKGSKVSQGAMAVRFEEVNFGYSKGVAIIKNVSFNLEKGKKLGLIGRTGSGKTTIAKLIMRFYDPQKGRVCIGEENVRDYVLDDLRKRIGYVTQDVQLFKASVRDNLTFYDKSIKDEKILTAIKEVGLFPWFMSLSNGLDTTLEISSLSAGESQLLALVRVLLFDPGLLIFDEASSRLDPVTESHLEKMFQKLMEGRTVIIIAHKLEVLKQVDSILVMEDGKLIEEGDPTEMLLDNTSYYYRLFHNSKGESEK